MEKQYSTLLAVSFTEENCVNVNMKAVYLQSLFKSNKMKLSFTNLDRIYVVFILYSKWSEKMNFRQIFLFLANANWFTVLKLFPTSVIAQGQNPKHDYS